MPTNYDRTDGGYKLPAITDPERICIQLEIPNDPEHKAAFWGALWTLTWYNAWQKDEAKRGRDVAAVWRDVWFKARAANVDWDACINCDEDGCVEYSPQYIQEWYPNNPYISVPDGLVKKWYIAAEPNLLGVPAGVVVTDILNTAPGGDDDFIRCRFTFSGTGTVEIHWHTVNFGGLALVQLDSDISKITLVELSSDLTAAPPEPPTQLQTEYEFIVPGEHHIDVTMIPQLNTDIEALGYGGGIVKIVFCGFDQMIITPQFRFTAECGMEQSNDNGATWNAIPGWDSYAADCFTGPAGEPGAPGADGQDGTDCECTDPYEEDGGVPTPPGESGDTKRCEVANRTVNSLLDRLFIPWLTDAATALYEQGLSDAELGNQFSDWAWVGGTYPFSTVGAVGSVVWNSWLAVVSSAVSIFNGAAGVAARATALVEAYAALDIIEMRDDIDSDSARQALMCALYENLNQDGDIDAATYANWKANIGGLTDGISVDARDNFIAFLDAFVPLGTVRQAAIDSAADTSFDCVACQVQYEWCKHIDFRDSQAGFGLGSGTTWESGVGIKSGGVYIPGYGTINSFSIDRDWGGFNPGTLVAVKIRYVGQIGDDGDAEMVIGLLGASGGENLEFSYDGTRTETFVIDSHPTYRVVTPTAITVARRPGAPAPIWPENGFFTLIEMWFYGTGTKPTWADTEEC